MLPAYKMSMSTNIVDHNAYEELIAKAELTPEEFARFNRAVNMNTNLTMQVSFREFGRRQNDR